MSDRRHSAPKFSYAVGGVIIAALGTMTVASAQSPFASKKKTQAWETAAATQPTPIRQAPVQTPVMVHPNAPVYASPLHNNVPVMSASPAPSPGAVYSSQAYPSITSTPPPQLQQTSPYLYAAPTAAASGFGSQPPQFSQGGYQTQSLQPNYVAPEHLPMRPSYGAPQASPYGQTQYSQSSPFPPTPYPPQTSGSQPYPPQGTYGAPRSWKDKLGLGRLTTVFQGFIKGGAAAVKRDNGIDSNWSEEFIADAKAEFEVSAVTDSGYEYGANFELRGDYDKFRRGFGGRITDCPPTELGCPSVLLDGVQRSLRGHTSRFYTDGPDEAEDAQLALESAHLFLRSAYGDVTIGRDDGAAYLFSLGAPTLLAVGASNSTVDYTGLDSVKTVNDASGFSEKITYTSPRLLGDSIGLGVQFGASYALNARACGANYCVKRNDGTGALSPDLEDIFEMGVALDRTFDNGLKVEATATYARGSEQGVIAAFDGLEAYNLGAEMSWMDVTLGGSFLKSNNGLIDGDYEAWDIGATWKPSALGFTLGYGHAKDELVNLTSDQFIAGVSYDFEKFTLGAGAQYIERETQGFDGTLVAPQTDKATALFIEGGIKF